MVTTNGKIMVVGLGPGSAEQMTARARAAIVEADVVIGYATYVALIEDLLDHQEVIKKRMTEETDRCLEALRQAEKGRKVALISSGDAGIYGMATLTYEVLFQSGWQPGTGIEVEVIPGTTALAACGSLVGAPLGHDFCAISLSDLLTPWPIIARRLEAAAKADFVLALYNPKSGRRTGQIAAAQRLLLLHRPPETPVAIVQSAYRPQQSIQMTTLGAMLSGQIGMLSTVLIGNRQTFLREGLMITPRGYGKKYTDLVGKAVPGERAGRSLSLGFEGWYGAVRAWLRRDDTPQRPTLEAAADHFDQPLAEILRAVAEADASGDHQTGDHPTNNHQTGDHQTGDHPTDNHQTGDHPTGDHPTDDHPTDDHRAMALNVVHLGAILPILAEVGDRRLLLHPARGASLSGQIQSLALTTHQGETTLQAVGVALQAHLPVRDIAELWRVSHPSDERLYLIDRFGNPLLALACAQTPDSMWHPFLLNDGVAASTPAGIAPSESAP